MVDSQITETLNHRERRQVLWTLCLTEIVSWGVLYYPFAVLGAQIAKDTGWPLTTLTALFSCALVVSGAVGIYARKTIHHRGPRWVMTIGSSLAAVSLVLIATAPNLAVFGIGWILAGASMAGVLYAPAFAAITIWFGHERVRALTAVTWWLVWHQRCSRLSRHCCLTTCRGVAPIWRSLVCLRS